MIFARTNFVRKFLNWVRTSGVRIRTVTNAVLFYVWMKSKDVGIKLDEIKRTLPSISLLKYELRIDRCDYVGCRNKPFAEVYPSLLKEKEKKKGWSYLCYRHWVYEDESYDNKLPWCSAHVNFLTNLWFTFVELFKGDHYPIEDEEELFNESNKKRNSNKE